MTYLKKSFLYFLKLSFILLKGFIALCVSSFCRVTLDPSLLITSAGIIRPIQGQQSFEQLKSHRQFKVSAAGTERASY